MKSKNLNRFENQGFIIIEKKEIIENVIKLRSVFLDRFRVKFSDDSTYNRNLIKRFADCMEVAQFFSRYEIQNILSSVGIQDPVFCGPAVTHFTSNDFTGDSYGLPFHQDWPSMVSSSNAIISWVSVNDCSAETHSLAVVPESHKKLYPGQQAQGGYALDQQEYKDSIILEVKAGALLLMSPFLIHKTYVNPDYNGWKLSLSRRYDDMACKVWKKQSYQNAYENYVDRDLYLKYSHT